MNVSAHLHHADATAQAVQADANPSTVWVEIVEGVYSHDDNGYAFGTSKLSVHLDANGARKLAEAAITAACLLEGAAQGFHGPADLMFRGEVVRSLFRSEAVT